MCLAKDEPRSPQKVAPPRSPWAKLLPRQSSKPRLPRNVTSTARVNLNKCWSKLGELISNAGPRADLPSTKTVHSEEPLLVPFCELFSPAAPAKPTPAEDNDSASDQNILNGSRSELIARSEIDDNLANEVREMCAAGATSDRFV